MMFVQCPFLPESTSFRANCASEWNYRCRAQTRDFGAHLSKSLDPEAVRCALACSIADQMMRTEREGADD